MRVTLSNGRQFVIKVRYGMEHKTSKAKDKFNRKMFIEWDEHTTMLTITEWFKKKEMSKATVTGFAHCNYQDTFDKEVGKSLAYFRALDKLEAMNIINPYEAEELGGFKLDSSSYVCKKVLNNTKE